MNQHQIWGLKIFKPKPSFSVNLCQIWAYLKSAKLNILSYKLFLTILSAILENLVKLFFRKVQNCDLGPKTAKNTFGQIWHQNRIFLDKIFILSYVGNILPTLSAILEKLLGLFFREVLKTVILNQNCHFSARLAKFRDNKHFSQKRALLSFNPYGSPTSC